MAVVVEESAGVGYRFVVVEEKSIGRCVVEEITGRCSGM